MSNQVYTLNTETWKWTEHTSEIEGEAPSPRYGHAAVALPDGRHLATFGGCDQADHMFFSSIALLDTLTWRWTTPKIQASLHLDCSNARQGCSTLLWKPLVMLVHSCCSMLGLLALYNLAHKIMQDEMLTWNVCSARWGS